MPGNWFVAERVPPVIPADFSGEFFDPYIAELDLGSVAEETDMAGGTLQAGVAGENFRFLDHVQIGVQDDHSVQRYFDVAPVYGDLLFVPLADGFTETGAGGNHI